ncbi:histidine kinase [Sorangium cellulosum]|uniref:histidine kinase n=1 Tax=Sorangium cellulosum TaxID=56 RepID=A0A4P2PV44_SORCE|nr:GAF domain-containing sensor histidine kinase [Sorangium cellulosum]AUX20539.1 histidine kinase [Sorangium cellulosum]
MRTIKQILSAHEPEIFESWTNEANRAAAARGLTRPELTNMMLEYVRSLARGWDGEEVRRERAELIESHLSSRLRAGFRLDETIEEFAILGRAILRACAVSATEARPSPEEIERLFAEIQDASVLVTQAYRQHLQDDAQTEKRYLRLLHAPFLEPLGSEAPLSSERLRKALDVVMESVGADTAALLLHDAGTGNLVMVASVGLAEEPLVEYARTVDASSFAGAVALRGQPMSIRDVETTSLDVPDGLRDSGIHSLLGVRLPAHRALLGIVYVGLCEKRPFTPQEIRRIQAIGERLALLIDNARLYEDLLGQLDAVRAERELREQFVSVLAHDLRGPLSAARMAATLLAARPDADGTHVARRVEVVVRNLDRADRMVIDLLDVARIHAGRRLSLTLEECDLGEIGRELVNELAVEHPGRLALHADEGARGIWGASELRRALWNLVSNALKYGAQDAPITVSILKRGDGVEARVHNEGAPISSEAQETMFEPFTRAAGERGAHGWGLGLMLVRACAEAHGGSVHVDTAPDRGTTFTLRLPADARPAQNGA